MNNLLNRVPRFLRNKYFIATAVFCVVMLFLDKNDLFTQLDRRKELRQNEQSKKYLSAATAAERKLLQALESNPAAVEKMAREKHQMKRDNEEVFLIPENYDTPEGKTKN